MDQILTAMYIYGGIGVLVALAFLAWGIDRVDAAAHGAWLVRPLLVPGVILLWPVVVARWTALERQKDRAE